MKSKLRKAGVVGLSAIMSACIASGSVLAFAKQQSTESGVRFTGVEYTDVTGKMDLSSVTLQNLSPSVLENAGLVQYATRTVIVTLDSDCVMDAAPNGMGASEYLGTYEGSRALKDIEKSQENFLTLLSSKGVSYKVVDRYSTVTNAVAIEVNTKYLSTIKSIPTVKYASVSQTYAYPEEATDSNDPVGTSNPSNVYATGIYDSSDYLDEYDGSGMTVAVLDTGLDYTHAAFQNMPETQSLTKQGLRDMLATKDFSSVKLSAERGVNLTVDDLYVNAKVPFAYDYADKDTDVYPAYSQHGVHVAGIVAGDAPSYTDKNGNLATDDQNNVLEFKGVAPGAQLVICKVFTDDFDSPDLGGANSEDIIAALEDCVLLGVDVINMSLGTTSGFSSLELAGDDEGIALAKVYQSIQKAGISLMCAAGNEYSSGFGSAFGTNLASNPDSGTVGSPSTFTGALSIGSINGQLAPFMYANGKDVVYYTEASDENAVKFDFGKQMLGTSASGTFKYVVVPGVGQAGDYTSTIKNLLATKQQGEKVIALVKRGTNTFKDKVEIAQRMGADAVIVYNNVAGTIGMSLGDLENPIPAVSITMDAGNALIYDENGGRRTTGTVEINNTYLAGPFMNDYSSWGSTPELKLKPEITSHGGEITSAVSGGYAEMSGTSMATPNLAGFTALLRGKLKQENPGWSAIELTQRVNQIIMSTAVTVYDQDGLPYSPRKQGAGLATLDNVFTTNAYLYTIEDDGGAEDNRPKVELGEDEQKAGVYNLKFYVANSGTSELTFKTQTIFMTETLSSDNLSVAEKAHLFGDIPAVWTADGTTVAEGGEIKVGAGQSVKIEVVLKLSDAEKKYLDSNFVNGMFVEGFLKLNSETEGQCGLTLPFMGFYGDWEAAPMLDYNCYEISAFKQDTSYTDETRPQAQVWATQPFATYYNDKYSVPMGDFCYLQNEFADQIYTNEDHNAVSIYNVYYGEGSVENYLTTTSIKALYAGLLRNAEIVTYDLYDSVTGELLLSDQVYRVSKAYAGGGSSVPANVKIELKPEDLGLVNNGKYELKFHFYFDSDDIGTEEDNNEDNAFTMTFYADYEAPVLVDARIRYYDYKENNQDKQRVYLDLDVYDNHYAQAVVLCYAAVENDTTTLHLATDYVTPIYNANKNGTTTVSIEITEFNDANYQNRFYVQIDDYALNHSVYKLNFTQAHSSQLPDSFEVVGGTEITIGVNETYKVELAYQGSANLSNFNWVSSSPTRIAKVNNGEIFGIAPGTAIVTVTGANGVRKSITVHVVESNTTLSYPSLSFGTIINSDNGLQTASGTVKVNAGQDFALELTTDPWYYPIANLDIKWASSDESIATVDQNGNVSVMEKKGTVRIEATIYNNGSATSYSAVVTLSVQEPFTISGSTLSAYHGRGGVDGVVKIPDDKNVMIIGEEAFKDNDNIRVLIIPKTVTQISKNAFKNCTALEEIYFIQEEPLEIPDANLAMILSDAFTGCIALKKVDLTNVKTITVASRAFMNCTALEQVVKMSNIGTMYDFAFAGCTSLKEADLTGLHNTGRGVFEGCTSLNKVTTAYYSSIGESIFSGCTALQSIEINSPVVSDNAFYNCTGLKTVSFGKEVSDLLTYFTIGNNAFYHCIQLEKVEFLNDYGVSKIGNLAFAECSKLTSINLPEGVELGYRVFENTQITDYSDDVYMGASYLGTSLVYAPATIPSDFVIREGTTEIADYAFERSTFPTGYTLVIPETVTKIGTGAFYRSNIKTVTLPEGLTEISAYAFALTGLTSVNIPASVTALGDYSFASCQDLASVTFDGSRENSLGLGSFVFYGCGALTAISLPELKATGNSVILPVYTFANCSSLASVSLANVTEIGGYAFLNNSSLTSINLNNVTVIGEGAFESCVSLAEVSALGSVKYIGSGAFYNNALTAIDISGAEYIGSFAFYANNASDITIPAGLKTLGGGAFANMPKLSAFSVDSANNNFFVKDGVLFRILSGTSVSGEYELCAYPTAKRAGLVDNTRVYEVPEGTVTVLAYAFADLASGMVGEVKLPYSVKSIGAGAFNNSGIISYIFESITAPALLSEYYDNSALTSYYTLYYTNFQDEFILHEAGISQVILKISYPSNGTGYDNYVFSNYFANKVLLGELMDDVTRSLKSTIEGLASAQEVAGWTSLEKNEENLAMVTAFSETVKQAHAVYNTVTGEKQLEYLGSANVEKLLNIETALKAVKSYFGISAKISELTLSADSTHKTEYKVGDKFDMTGLKITVIYDDYSTEEADMSQVKLSAGYDGELTALNRYVRVEYMGKTLQVRITVEDEEEINPTPNPGPGVDEETGCASCSSTIFGGAFCGIFALGLVALAVVCSLIRRKKPTDGERK